MLETAVDQRAAGGVRSFVRGLPDNDGRFQEQFSNGDAALGFWEEEKKKGGACWLISSGCIVVGASCLGPIRPLAAARLSGKRNPSVLAAILGCVWGDHQFLHVFGPLGLAFLRVKHLSPLLLVQRSRPSSLPLSFKIRQCRHARSAHATG